MQLQRNEIATGLLVLVTAAIFIVALLALGSPGVFHSTKSYAVAFDNAAGIKIGAPVLLAGRYVGQVSGLKSPIDLPNSPKGHRYEALIEIKVRPDTQIYSQVEVQMRQLGLLGEQVIDFTHGDSASGLAPPATLFFGDRQRDAAEAANDALNSFKPLAEEALATIKEMRETTANFTRLTTEGSSLDVAINRFKDVGNNLDRITTQIQKSGSLTSTLRELRGASEELSHTAANARQFTDTIKRQPWRLIWPSTKQYPDDDEEERTSGSK